MRSTMVMLLLVGPLLAQTRVDFSGVFLRTATIVGKKRLESEPPRILVISQTPDEIFVKAMQNGETAVAHYPLEAKKSDKVQAKLKGRSLVLTFNLADLETAVSEKWVLSPDGQQLTIQGEQGPAEADTGGSSSISESGRKECMQESIPVPAENKEKRVHIRGRGSPRDGVLPTGYPLRPL